MVQRNIEILFALKGSICVTVNNVAYELKPHDVILINSGDAYQVKSKEQNLMLDLHIEYEFLEEATRKEQVYICNSCIDGRRNYNLIKKLMAEIAYEYFNSKPNYELKTMALLYDLIYVLNEQFIAAESKEEELNDADAISDSRIHRIILYIRQNYYRNISLTEVADALYLTPQYLSKFFKAKTGVTFIRYLNEFRLSQAIKKIIYTDESITKIAMDAGFPNLQSFNKAFKEVYNITPAKYRDEMKKKLAGSGEEVQIASYIAKEADYKEAEKELALYMADYKTELENTDYKSVEVDVNAQAMKPVKHTWKNLINLGYAYDGLRSDVQQHLTDIQSSIGFKYVRFQDIFSNEMLCDEGNNIDKWHYNFTKIDKLLDFLLDIGCKPFIELARKDKVLNLTPTEVLYWSSHSKGQATIDDFISLLKSFIVHCVNRYGINEVSKWYFEIWKGGDFNRVFWNGDFDSYINVFKSYYNTIKQLVPDAHIGGPGMNPELNLKWFGKLLDEWRKNDVMPDFISLSMYFGELPKDYEEYMGDEFPPLFVSKDKEYVKLYLTKIKNILKQSGVKIPDIFITEWNSTISHRQLTNDTTFKSAFIAKNVVDTLDEVSGLGYWFCSDVSGELKDSSALLCGEMGLINTNGIRKPGFYAYEFLSKLGDKLVKKGDGYIITSFSPNDYEILVYNYKHFNELYCLNEQIKRDMDKYDNYSEIFEDWKDLELRIKLKNIKKGNYRIKKHILNRQSGSIFDEWLNMDMISELEKSEINYLKRICIPRLSINYITDADELVIESKLEPHEVNLYEVTFVL